MTNFNSVICHFLVIAFGAGSWMGINAVWVELPLLVNALPEKWDLPSYLVVLVQITCVAPLIFGVVKHFFGNRLNQPVLIVAFLALSSLGSLLCALIWTKTTYIGRTSLVLVALVTNCASELNSGSSLSNRMHCCRFAYDVLARNNFTQ